MCSGNQQGRPQPTMVPAADNPHHVGRKRPLTAAGEEDRLRRRKRAREAARAGALVSYVAPASAPIDARPINAVPLAAVAPPLAAGEVPVEPSWIRKIVFYRLGLRYDLPLVFIEEKTVTRTDLDSHQNRFRLACSGVARSLIPMLTRDEAIAASFLQQEEEGTPPSPPPPSPCRATPPPPPPQPENNTRVVVAADDGEQQQPKEEKEEGQPDAETTGRKKKRGRSHGGLPVTLVHLRGGIKHLLLTRWDSSGAAIIKGEGYLDFIARCGVMEKDVVHVWAFKQQEFRLFGATYPGSPLCIVIASAPRPRFAAPPPPPTAQAPMLMI